jgi:hypothetical protein
MKRRRRRNPARRTAPAAPSSIPSWLMLGLGGGALYLLYQVTQSITSAEGSLSSAASSVSGSLSSASGAINSASSAVQNTAGVASQTIQDTGAAAQSAAYAAQAAANQASSTASAYDPSSLWDDVFGEDDSSS